jgi:hypothetical protein
VRDGINIIKTGRPVVVFVQDRFEAAARAQAKALGVPGLKMYVYPQYKPGGDSVALEEAKAAMAAVKATEDLPALLQQAG